MRGRVVLLAAAGFIVWVAPVPVGAEEGGRRGGLWSRGRAGV
ncbi:MAG TPA: hypothetical protein VGX48_27390 [Pyrinomonadaceae bacterium]|nr:hypothetical protein [Pyrinomonadaceae bacterium]